MFLFIQVPYYEDESAPTGTCAVCVVGGERLVSTCVPTTSLKQELYVWIDQQHHVNGEVEVL